MRLFEEVPVICFHSYTVLDEMSLTCAYRADVTKGSGWNATRAKRKKSMIVGEDDKG